MSKALVIKGANFGANKVETITLTQPIPCTGLSISPTSKAFETLGATQQITPTITPADTTDTVTYASSNEDVATVSATGLITCIGIGSATITVTCGTQSATCSVTVTHTIILDDVYTALNGYGYSGSIDYTASPVKDYVGYNAKQYGRLYYSDENILDGYPAFVSDSNKYAIPIPKGTKSISFTPPQGLRVFDHLILVNSSEKQTYIGGSSGNAALGLRAFAAYNSGSDVDVPIVRDITEYPSADSFIVSLNGTSSVHADEITGKTSITFSGD